MTTTAPESKNPTASDVFISYSRHDKDFVRRLDEALQRHEREAWVEFGRKRASLGESTHATFLLSNKRRARQGQDAQN